MYEVFLKMFGVCIGYSVFRIFLRQNFVTEDALTKIVIGFFSFHLLQIIFIQNFLINWILIYISVGLIGLFAKIYLEIRKTQFRKEFPAILTSIILNMKLGQSFRQALRAASANTAARWSATMIEIYQDVAFSPQTNTSKNELSGPFLREIQREFKKIDCSTHKTVEKVENFRRRLMIIEKFRRRSGRIRGQVHFQIIIMSFIYVGVFAINSFMFPLARYKFIVLLSLIAFFVGFVLVLLIGKKIQWKI
ncbi:hypothetical protein K2X05_01215 [bacterium]|nr:hypothetical protein [bacterium]